jgi:Flp pilus assembly protein TadG
MSPSKTTLRQCFGRLRGGVVRSFGHRFAAGTSGMAATEFAMIAPVLIIMYMGVTELTDAYDAGTRTTAVASTAADLIAQEKIVCNAEMADAFEALEAIMYPYPTTNTMDIVISSVIDAGNGTVKVAWSDAIPDSAKRAVNSTDVPIPAGLVTTGGSVILAEVTYRFHPLFGGFFLSDDPFTISDKYYLHPRKTEQIDREASC